MTRSSYLPFLTCWAKWGLSRGILIELDISWESAWLTHCILSVFSVPIMHNVNSFPSCIVLTVSHHALPRTHITIYHQARRFSEGRNDNILTWKQWPTLTPWSCTIFCFAPVFPKGFLCLSAFYWHPRGLPRRWGWPGPKWKSEPRDQWEASHLSLSDCLYSSHNLCFFICCGISPLSLSPSFSLLLNVVYKMNQSK